MVVDPGASAESGWDLYASEGVGLEAVRADAEVLAAAVGWDALYFAEAACLCLF